MTISRVKLIKTKNFIAAAFDPDNEVFVVHIAFISQDLDIYPFQRALIAFLKIDKTVTSVLCKYTDFAYIFSKNLAAKLLKHIGINNHAINIIERD